MKNTKSIFSQRSGSSLLLALMIVSAVTTLALGTGALFLQASRSQRTLLDGTQAFYAAEGGVERGLYLRANPTPSYITDTKTALGESKNSFSLTFSASAIDAVGTSANGSVSRERKIKYDGTQAHYWLDAAP